MLRDESIASQTAQNSFKEENNMFIKEYKNWARIYLENCSCLFSVHILLSVSTFQSEDGTCHLQQQPIWATRHQMEAGDELSSLLLSSP